ncbi:unnamed protein product [Effrenium voratum]|nr:unnamed protein product [Effrenium voratum]
MKERPHPPLLRLPLAAAGGSGVDPVRVVQTQQLVQYFENNYSNFLGGLLAEHGAPQPSPMCGTTLKSFTSATPRPHFEVDFERHYRPSSRRRKEREQGASPSRTSSKHINVSQAESPRGREGSRQTTTRLTAVSLPSPRDRGRGKDFGRDLDSGEALKDDDEARRREACESLRTLVLGSSVEHSPEKEKEWIAQHRRGTEEEVETFCHCWCQMDVDADGDVDLDEFAGFFSKRKVDRLLGLRCVRYLMPRAGQAGGQAKAAVTKEEMMRLMWPHATTEDMDYMCTVFDHGRLRAIEVQPPKMLPRKRRNELLKCFDEMDRQNLGLVPYSDLIPAGVADQNMVKVLRDKYDKDSTGNFDKNAFLEMMAPLGYRAHPSVSRVVCKDGKEVRLVQWSKDHLHFEGWLSGRHYEKLKATYGFPE